MKERAGSFALEVESISFNSVTFLDIDLWTAEHAHSHHSIYSSLLGEDCHLER